MLKCLYSIAKHARLNIFSLATSKSPIKLVSGATYGLNSKRTGTEKKGIVDK